jgi:hypothetical protein
MPGRSISCDPRAVTAAASSVLRALELGFDAGRLGELVGDQPPPGASDLVTQADSAEQSLVWVVGHRCPAGQQLGEEPMGPAQALDVGPGQRIPAITQQPQHLPVGVDANLAQPPVPQRDHDHRVRVVGVGLAPLPASNTRALAASLSSTRSPSASRRCATGRPTP